MSLHNRKVVLTGWSGGLGQHVAAWLLEQRASVATISRSDNGPAGARHCQADLSSPDGRATAASFVSEQEPDVLINLAGIQYFGPSEQQPRSDVEATYAVNLLAPVVLCQAALPSMKRRGSGQIINVGSILGSIGMAYFATYSSSKAGLRLFSEAMRRELADTAIEVTYLAPRAARTGLITRKLAQYAELTGMAIDEPRSVAMRIVSEIQDRNKEVHFGTAESFFVKLNAAMPRLLDLVLARNDRKAGALFEIQNPAGKGASV